MNNKKISILSFIILIAIVACKKEANKITEIKNQKEFNSPDGMVWVNGKTFLQVINSAILCRCNSIYLHRGY